MGLLRYINEQLLGYHRYVCGKCGYAIHPWEVACKRCGSEINWNKVYTDEELSFIRSKRGSSGSDN
jgi:uncharacterized OB-fold protein